jgi:hypothetical protein
MKTVWRKKSLLMGSAFCIYLATIQPALSAPSDSPVDHFGACFIGLDSQVSLDNNRERHLPNIGVTKSDKLISQSPLIVYGKLHGQEGFLEIKKGQAPIFYRMTADKLGLPFRVLSLRPPYVSTRSKPISLDYDGRDGTVVIDDTEKSPTKTQRKKRSSAQADQSDRDQLTGTPIAEHDAMDFLTDVFRLQANFVQKFAQDETNGQLAAARGQAAQDKKICKDPGDCWKYNSGVEESHLPKGDYPFSGPTTRSYQIEMTLVNFADTFSSSCRDQMPEAVKTIANNALSDILKTSRVTGDYTVNLINHAIAGDAK